MTEPDRLRAPSILVVMHARAAPAALLGEAIVERGGGYATVMPHEGTGSGAPLGPAPLPASHAGWHGLIVLGGKMAASDDAGFPHFAPLLELIRGFDAAGKPVLGVCLGAQLLARAFGARVYPQGFLEFGFHPVALTAAGRSDPLLEGLGPDLRVMQWHEDSFDLPEGARLLATGRDCPHQIFRVGTCAYGFQCHFEVNADIARDWVWLRREAIAAQDPAFFARFEAELARHMAGAMAFCRAVAGRWLDRVAAGLEAARL